MKSILGHRSWNAIELVQILKNTGTFTMCTLPHYRYRRVKDICYSLEKRGFIQRHKRGENNLTWMVTEQFKEWAMEFDNSETTMQPFNWIKSKKKEIAA